MTTARPATDPAAPPLSPAGGRLYRALCRVIEALHRRGWPRSLARHDLAELRGYALAIEYMLQAGAWSRRHGAPSWSAVHAAWARCAASTARRDALAGQLQRDDRFELVADGPEAFERRSDLYARARQRLDVASYYIQPDETGHDTVQAWAACVARGVRVRLLVDAYAMRKKALEVDGMPALLDALARAGVELQLWHDPHRPFDSTHRKMIVVDGHTALVGGRNFADHYRGRAWRDVDLLLQGPSVAALADSFDALWRGLPAPLPPARPWQDHVPADILDDPVMTFVLSAIGGARASVDLELAYFVDQPPLCDALVQASRRGVRVRLLGNSAASNDLPYVVWSAMRGMRTLLEAGCEVHLRPGVGRTLHCKYVLVDRAWVSFGSHNLDPYSSRYVCENNLVAHAPALGEALGAFFDSGLAQAEPLQLEQARQWLARNRLRGLYPLLFRDFQ